MGVFRVFRVSGLGLVEKLLLRVGSNGSGSPGKVAAKLVSLEVTLRVQGSGCSLGLGFEASKVYRASFCCRGFLRLLQSWTGEMEVEPDPQPLPSRGLPWSS